MISDRRLGVHLDHPPATFKICRARRMLPAVGQRLHDYIFPQKYVSGGINKDLEANSQVQTRKGVVPIAERSLLWFSDLNHKVCQKECSISRRNTRVLRDPTARENAVAVKSLLRRDRRLTTTRSQRLEPT
ncbi:hypothetical protein TNCV_338241 [Trichonephila clavipes]|nr:hypothetical protein TNCV_338241 [Trichonephila clavipes]